MKLDSPKSPHRPACGRPKGREVVWCRLFSGEPVKFIIFFPKNRLMSDCLTKLCKHEVDPRHLATSAPSL